jgi:HlyD family secretion protein
VILAFLVLAIAWAVFGSIDRIVVAPGKVVSRTPLVVMQSFTTSRITQIHVKPGDHVRRGQILVSFDPAFAQADVASLRTKAGSLSAIIERIEAQLAGRPFAVASSDSPERVTQAQIYSQEMATYAADMAVRDSRAGAVDAQIKAGNISVAGLRQQLETAQKVVSMRKSLLEQKAGSTLDVMMAESNAVEIDLRLKNTIGEVSRLTQQQAEIQAERRSYLDKWRSDHNQQLVQARQEFVEASETLNKARKMQDLAEIRSPADAVVLEIADRSVGSVLREAETLMTLVPDGANLYIEANVPSRDIGYLKVGDAARVKLETYPFQRYGTLNGELSVIGADSVPLKQGDQSQLVYRAQVRLTDNPADLAERGLRIKPGLVATAEITTGKRSIASYILDPILRTSDEGLREP